MLDEEEIKEYFKAGKAVANALKKIRDKIHIGMKVYEICEIVENEILNSNAKLAFPCNVSINHIAAHDTADFQGIEEVKSDSVIKIDAGAHVNGYITDAAITISFDKKYEKMIEVTKKALMKALENIRANIYTSDIGKIINAIVKNSGYSTIKNLYGHLIKKYTLHAGKNIPNYDDGSKEVIKEGEVYAIEPFVTNGKGYVKEINVIKIYSLKKPFKKSKDEFSNLLNNIWMERYTLPFSARWYKDKVDYFSFKKYLDDLVDKGEIIGYNVLVEESKGIVVQEEHTVIIKDRKEILIPTYID